LLFILYYGYNDMKYFNVNVMVYILHYIFCTCSYVCMAGLCAHSHASFDTMYMVTYMQRWNGKMLKCYIAEIEFSPQVLLYIYMTNLIIHYTLQILVVATCIVSGHDWWIKHSYCEFQPHSVNSLQQKHIFAYNDAMYLRRGWEI